MRINFDRSERFWPLLSEYFDEPLDTGVAALEGVLTLQVLKDPLSRQAEPDHLFNRPSLAVFQRPTTSTSAVCEETAGRGSHAQPWQERGERTEGD